MSIWKRKLARDLFARIPELSREKLLQALGVEQDNPLLVAVTHVLKGYEEAATESAAQPKISESERAYHAGGIGWLAEAQEELLKLAEEGRAARAGSKN